MKNLFNSFNSPFKHLIVVSIYYILNLTFMNKTISKWFSLLLLMLVGTVSASAQLTADNTEIDRGATKQITLTYSGTEAIYGYQTDIQLPEGLSWAADPAEADEVFTASSSAQGTNGKRVVAYSAAGNTVAPQTEVLTFSVKASDDFNGGTIQLTNTKISLADDVQQNVANAVIEVSLAKYATKYIADEAAKGTVEDKTDIPAGESVTLTATPNEGYKLATMYGTLANVEPEQRVEINAETLTFTMPANDVYIHATFEGIPYNVTVTPATGGTVEADKATAIIGETVTLTVTPDAGYELDALTVMNGETPVEVTNNTFVMPAAAVTVTATFKQTAVAVDQTPIFITFPDYNDKSVGSYTAEWTANKEGKVWTFNGFNNNQNKWAYIKAGRKNYEQTATVTSPVVNAQVTDVVITVDKTSNITSVTLEVLDGETVVETKDITETFVAGDVDVEVEGASGYNYKLTINSTSATDNGPTQISKIALYGPDEYVAPVTTYAVTVAATENGTVVANPVEAAEGATVALTVTPAENYEVDAVSAAYNDVTGAPVAVELTATEIGYTFVMPAADVTVTATFKAKQTEPVKVEYKVESYVGSFYEALPVEIDLDGILGLIGATTETYKVVAEYADETRADDVRGNTDGWHNAEGNAETWGDNAMFYLQDTNDANIFSMGGMEGKTGEVGDYTGTLVFINTETNAEQNVTFTLSYINVPLVTRNILDVTVVKTVEYSRDDADYTKKTIELTEDDITAITSALGLESLADENLQIFGYNPSDGSFVADWLKYDGWRSAAGDFAEFSGRVDVPACVKIQEDGLAIADGKYNTYNIYGATGTVKTYWAYANATDAVLVEVDVKYLLPYVINCAETENGAVVADPTTAVEGAAVALTVTPAENYEIDAVSAAYNDVTGAPVELELTATETGYTFVMPAADVTITVTFKAKAEPADLSGIIINAPFIPDADPIGWAQDISGSFRDIGMYAIGGESSVRFAAPTVDENHLATEYAAGFECRWNGNFSAYTQTTGELPAGTYALRYDVENVNGSTTSANYENRFYVKVGETTYTDESTEWMKGKSSWTTHLLQFTLEEAGSIDISLGYGTGTNNISADNTPAIYVSHLELISGAELARAALAEEIAKAEAEQAKYGVGEGLFQYPESEIKPIADAIEAAKAVLNDDAATAQAIREATQTLKDAEEVFAPKINEPEADKAYILSVTTDAGTFQLNIEGTANTIAEQGTPIYFAKQEDGTYALTADKENYVVYEGSNAWTMSTSATPYGFTIAALADGGYTIKGKNGFYATNKGDGDAAGSAVYGDKSASNGNYIWNIALAEEETPEVTLKGDVSNDGKLSVVDVTMTVDFIVEAAEPTAYQKAAADMNGDETITVDDAAQIIQGILDFDYNAAEEVEPEPTAKARVSNADFLAIDGSRIDLNNSNEFVAFQMDVTVNGTLNAVNLTNRTANHTLRYNKISDNTYRIVVLSMSNSKLEGNNGAILDIDAIGDFEISNARFIDSSINACYINVDNTVTGISDVEAATLNAKAIYTVGGARVNTLQKGLNIVRKADGTTVKVFVK